MANEMVGVLVNVIRGKKEPVKERVIKQLKTGVCRTEAGTEFNVSDVFNRGKGKFVTRGAKGGAVAKPSPAKMLRAMPLAVSAWVNPNR